MENNERIPSRENLPFTAGTGLAPDVPAVLIDTGFLSNAADERRLADARARERMADAMAQAVDAYFAPPALYAAAD